ncbi:hypothetical protein APJL_1866 [Actinobacillus pleuropneumoniae serovar 3 str. JL03]|uniref:Uncharacterized protein n=1 Tax=Actinobacillus pleuropneumoniae serotype 3 (strain JL03) TaxID=434271 RepID=B0BT02_ACTPJ|nr:hypothetical protein APJL_1866 [Actinobacillus pleuropneumoniae serovar 3 str. JL03]
MNMIFYIKRSDLRNFLQIAKFCENSTAFVLK